MSQRRDPELRAELGDADRLADVCYQPIIDFARPTDSASRTRKLSHAPSPIPAFQATQRHDAAAPRDARASAIHDGVAPIGARAGHGALLPGSSCTGKRVGEAM